MGVFPTTTAPLHSGGFPTTIYIWGGGSSCSEGKTPCLLLSHDLLPFVGCRGAAARQIGDPEAIGLPKIAIPCPTVLCDLEKPQRDTFADGRRYGVAIDAIGLEIVERDDKGAVVHPAMPAMLAFDPGQHAMRR